MLLSGVSHRDIHPWIHVTHFPLGGLSIFLATVGHLPTVSCPTKKGLAQASNFPLTDPPLPDFTTKGSGPSQGSRQAVSCILTQHRTA